MCEMEPNQKPHPIGKCHRLRCDAVQNGHVTKSHGALFFGWFLALVEFFFILSLKWIIGSVFVDSSNKFIVVFLEYIQHQGACLIGVHSKNVLDCCFCCCDGGGGGLLSWALRCLHAHCSIEMIKYARKRSLDNVEMGTEKEKERKKNGAPMKMIYNVWKIIKVLTLLFTFWYSCSCCP